MHLRRLCNVYKIRKTFLMFSVVSMRKRVVLRIDTGGYATKPLFKGLFC